MAQDGKVSMVRCVWSKWQSLVLVLGLLGAGVLFSGCSKSRNETPDIIILHTGRMRGNVYPLSLQSIAPLQHYQYLAGYIKKVREEAAQTGTKVFLVDLGDSLTGSFASHVTDSENMVTFFNDAGYDAVVLSNLDNTVTPKVLGHLKAKVLNPFQDSSSKPATAGTAFGGLFNIGTVPIYLLANFYGDTSSKDFPDRFPAGFGTTPTDVGPVRDYGAVLSSLGERPAGSLTVLSWMKFESPKSPPENFLESLRRLGVDAILAHRIYGGKEKDVWTDSGFYDWKPPVSLNILRNNAGFALSRLDLKREGNGWRVLKHQLLPMTANTAPADSAMVEAIANFAPAISAADTKIADLPENVGEDAVLKMYMSALAEVPGAEAILYSTQSIRTDWPAGELRASQVFNSLPWTTPIVIVSLTPAQVAEAVKDLNLVLAEKDGLTGDVVHVATSHFFARLISAKFGSVPVQETAIRSEFDYFVNFLKTHPPAKDGELPQGWSLNPGMLP